MSKYMSYTALLTTVYLVSSMSIAKAEPAVLADNLQLHIPVIQYQNQYLWADLNYLANSTDGIRFKVNNYGVLSADSIAPQLFDLAMVTAGAAPAIVDIKDNEARLTFISSVPLACSVVYGKTPAFGAVAIDGNMNGGAIIIHNPILSDLQAETLYYYRVQGVDAQGKLYWAATDSFTTSAVNTADNNILSLNNGATVTEVSSNFGGVQNDQAWGANSAIDGSSNSAWSSADDGNDAFIEITLPQAEQIQTLEVWSRSMNDGSAKIFSFTITVDNAEVLGPFILPDTQQAYQFTINRLSSSIRLDVVNSSGGNTGLIDMAAFK